MANIQPNKVKTIWAVSVILQGELIQKYCLKAKGGTCGHGETAYMAHPELGYLMACKNPKCPHLDKEEHFNTPVTESVYKGNRGRVKTDLEHLKKQAVPTGEKYVVILRKLKDDGDTPSILVVGPGGLN